MAKPPAGIEVDLEGLHAVGAGLATGRVRSLYVERSRTDSPGVVSLMEKAGAVGVAVEITDDLGALTRTAVPQGVFARCHPLSTYSLDELVSSQSPPALLLLDHWQDPHNVGAAIRSAYAAGVNSVVLPRLRSAPITSTVAKVAAGAIEYVRIGLVSSLAACMKTLSDRGVWLVGLDSNSEQRLWDHPLFTEPVAIVAGGEGKGLGRLVRSSLDSVASIPMAPPTESLNAAVAVSLACYEIARSRHSRGN